MTAKKSEHYACVGCFADEELIKFIREAGSLGPCYWCNATRAHRIEILALRDSFQEVARMYQQSEDQHGEFLSSFLTHYWQIFSERLVDRGSEHYLTEAILTAGISGKDLFELEVDYGGLFVERPWYSSSMEEEWEEEICSIVSPVSPPTSPDTPPLENQNWGGGIDFPDPQIFGISDKGNVYPTDIPLFRARIYNDRKRTDRFSLDEMGAPPPEKTPMGRVNKKGDPVLYLASDSGTALAEVRPWKGAVVAIASLKLTRPLYILNLSKPYYVNSPFFIEGLAHHCEVYALLNRFGEELSRPIMPHEKESYYLPSHNICEKVQNAAFDGIAFPSAMGQGHNIVIFKPDEATPFSIEHRKIMGISFADEELSQHEPIFEDLPWS